MQVFVQVTRDVRLAPAGFMLQVVTDELYLLLAHFAGEQYR